MRLVLLTFLVALALIPGAGGAAAPVPNLKHIVVIVFENKESYDVLGNSRAPTFNRLAADYAQLDSYYGVSHPSLANYLALISGSTHGVTKNCTSCVFGGPTLAGALERAHRTWKTYAEGLPRRGFTGASAGPYAKKHVPFLYFKEVLSRPARRNRVVPVGTLAADLRRGALPSFSLVVPDLCHSMHDCPVATGDRWLQEKVTPLLDQPGTVVFVIFDEGTTNEHGGGHVAALALGTTVRPGSRSAVPADHYALLRTIEAAWGLPRLGRSKSAAPITGIWR